MKNKLKLESLAAFLENQPSTTVLYNSYGGKVSTDHDQSGNNDNSDNNDSSDNHDSSTTSDTSTSYDSSTYTD